MLLIPRVYFVAEKKLFIKKSQYFFGVSVDENNSLLQRTNLIFQGNLENAEGFWHCYVINKTVLQQCDQLTHL